jgi:hypothetical protein
MTDPAIGLERSMSVQALTRRAIGNHAARGRTQIRHRFEPIPRSRLQYCPARNDRLVSVAMISRCDGCMSDAFQKYDKDFFPHAGLVQRGLSVQVRDSRPLANYTKGAQGSPGHPVKSNGLAGISG